MITKESKRGFKMSLAELNGISLEKLAFAERDIEKFGLYGYTTETLNSIRAKQQLFSNTEQDDQLMARQVLISETKKQVSAELRTQAKQINVMIDLVYGRTNPEFVNHFTIKELSKISIPELINEATKLVAMAREYQNSLIVIGLTPETINTVEQLIAQLNDVTTSHKISMAKRDLATANRYNNANDLYNSIVDLCKIGRAVWMDESEAHYNDYVIYENQYSTPEVTEEIPEIPPTIEPIPVLG